MMEPTSAPTAASALLRVRPGLIDERSRPDFRDVYGRLLEGAESLDVAIRKVRLAGMSLGRSELTSVAAIRVLLAEINVLTLASEAEQLATDPAGRRRLTTLIELLAADVLAVRSAPLGGWAPDFSIFRLRSGEKRLLVGPHWFARPYPHRGPALASVHGGRDAARVARRFEAIWADAHPLATPIRRVLEEAMGRGTPR